VVTIFPGNYEDYLYRKGREATPSSSAAAAAIPSIPFSRLDEQAGSGGPKQRRLNPIKLKQLRQRLPEVEEEITKLEAEITDCETRLQSFVSAEETRRVTELLARRKDELANLMDDWEELSQVIEANA
jgi:ATP-binding cassette, subfamily F, member 3